MTISDQVAKVLCILGRGQSEVHRMACETLNWVGLLPHHFPPRCFPHELSGGLWQCNAITIAIANHPKLLIMDELTTALDVTMQAHILDLLTWLMGDLGMGMLRVHKLKTFE
jgi:peptide/nickel transport system ATP-binding protein